jgi:predicted Zn-ribbon and HTH transcriptional regulator
MIICRNCSQTFINDSTKVESVDKCPKCEGDGSNE